MSVKGVVDVVETHFILKGAVVKGTTPLGPASNQSTGGWWTVFRTGRFKEEPPLLKGIFNQDNILATFFYTKGSTSASLSVSLDTTLGELRQELQLPAPCHHNVPVD